MIQVNTFVDAVDKTAQKVREYAQPGDINKGTCDCIGLIIYAKR